jgi:hypothetical protein
MRKSSAALAALVMGGMVLPLHTQDDDGLTWIDDYSKALRIAKETKKPLFVEYRCEP